MAGKSESNPIPTRNATSQEIRNFFKQFLSTTVVSIDDSKASEIANRWPQNANGIQLWTFGARTYRDIFDKENGMLLWSHIHSVTEDDKEVIFQARPVKKLNTIERSITVGVFLVMALFTGLIAALAPSPFNTAGFTCAFFLGFACWVWVYA